MVFMDEDRNAEKISIQMQLNRLHDEWMISVTKGDLEASDRLWHEMDVVYQKLRDLLPIDTDRIGEENVGDNIRVSI